MDLSSVGTFGNNFRFDAYKTSRGNNARCAPANKFKETKWTHKQNNPLKEGSLARTIRSKVVLVHESSVLCSNKRVACKWPKWQSVGRKCEMYVRK